MLTILSDNYGSASKVRVSEGKRGGLGWRELRESHARFPAHNSVPQSAPVMSTDYPNTLNHAFPHGASLNTGQKIYCAWAVPSTKSRVFMDGNSFSTSRPRFRPFSWTAASSAAAKADVPVAEQTGCDICALGQAKKRQHRKMLSNVKFLKGRMRLACFYD